MVDVLFASSVLGSALLAAVGVLVGGLADDATPAPDTGAHRENKEDAGEG